ncbi:hypothetical protein QJS10_CPA16g00865 [Acorus calamus]|uniref:Uncharacterized protein n=1 Tax=Acorus calamus TaxID=4465 RepID=A0AAV9D3V8_ACOCL|nr:hypothetical protein QJS10_CPA16g00865 [Acorus calamus]
MATSGWLTQKIVPIIHRTPKLGASKLKNEIQTKYNLTLPYSRVLKARGSLSGDSVQDHCQSRMLNLIVRQSKLVLAHSRLFQVSGVIQSVLLVYMLFSAGSLSLQDHCQSRMFNLIVRQIQASSSTFQVIPGDL